jgi:tRNA (cytidine/uridine-2'-O-)-methyltransferase
LEEDAYATSRRSAARPRGRPKTASGIIHSIAVAKPSFDRSRRSRRGRRFLLLLSWLDARVYPVVAYWTAMRLVLFEPDIPQNTGALLRLGACLGVPVDIIEPCGFVISDRRLRRAGLDYLALAQLVRHESWAAFRAALAPTARLVLLTTRGTVAYHRFAFAPADVLLLGRESAGVPEHVHAESAARVLVPMLPGRRSLNVALAAAMVLGEAMRQTALLPERAA